MTGDVAYLEASAAVKLFSPEPESPFLRGFLLEWPQSVASELLETEAARVARILGRSKEALTLVSALGLIPVSTEILRDASTVSPPHLPVAAAVHVATALSLGGRLGVFLAYEPVVVDAARREGLRVASPRE